MDKKKNKIYNYIYRKNLIKYRYQYKVYLYNSKGSVGLSEFLNQWQLPIPEGFTRVTLL